MTDLSIDYLGIKLKNPLIVGASTFSADVEMAKELEESGASAIVLKSLFEEQIQMERAQLDDLMEEYANRNAEMTSLFPKLEHSGPKEHLLMLENLKKNLNIPVIASLNCVYDVTWVEFAEMLEAGGADALELNFYSVPSDLEKNAQIIEEEKLKIVEQVSSRVNIPISVKLSAYYTNVLNVVQRMENAGAKGFIMFNRLFQPEIDSQIEEHVTHFDLTNHRNYRLSLRYIGLLYKKIQSDLIGNGGIYAADDVIQLLLSGANSVQIVSAIYKHKPSIIKSMLYELKSWMKEKKYKTINEFRGNLSDEKLYGSYAYKRAQYLDYILNPGEIIKKYLMR